MMQLGFDSLYHPYYFTSKLLNSNDDIVDANLKLAQNWPWFRLLGESDRLFELGK